MAVTKKAKTGTKGVAKKAGKVAAKSSSAAKTTKAKPAAAKAAAPKAASASKKAAPKKATAVKLNDRQSEYLKKIKDAGETGYEAGPSYEQRTIDALVERKLVKKGAKDKQSGKHRYTLSKSGEKHLTSAPPSSTPATPAP